MKNDIILNKIATIERCQKRIQEVYHNNPANLRDYTKQDSIILNIQRACEAAIDLAMHIVSEKHLGLPQTSRDAFDMLEEHDIIANETAQNLKSMVGFRNIAVHNYQSLNIDIMQKIIEKHMNDFSAYTKQIVAYQK
ncbi:type VII toxin-antitoxin system HepT family RNase toxin [Alkalihalobacillus pseudalcaliphilus]|uniref:type VII toxin-antitoxin system HepT family RNase toxin n=1 Tax=Alkalihalobacillus pseudalcaliphilus TaxID=79884 RepID=UPI00064D7972|nr:DUF86 domain-containing protein [Alkalihalobacillus pseudalcaliphilus]KMK74358.1 hypothetical protein AB990_20795 [Alkalihalobacillus pseudalcaliphilus]